MESYTETIFWDISEAREQLEEKFTKEDFRRGYLEGLDRMFTKGYMNLRTYLELRNRMGLATKFSRITSLLIQKVKRIVIK